MKGLKTVYICSSCEYESIKWAGRCPRCGAWNSFVEDVIELPDKTGSADSKKQARAELRDSVGGNADAVPIDGITEDSCIRTATGQSELDRVLGGGLVKGSVVLLTRAA